eukprot:GFYU01010646.1.p1 GENE.GFYU01010646.1~~GFYU01010646.1.p1  ORF type:complete len:611 (-),score=127.06 GFYU01010646.1:235-2067(-)
MMSKSAATPPLHPALKTPQGPTPRGARGNNVSGRSPRTGQSPSPRTVQFAAQPGISPIPRNVGSDKSVEYEIPINYDSFISDGTSPPTPVRPSQPTSHTVDQHAATCTGSLTTCFDSLLCHQEDIHLVKDSADLVTAEIVNHEVDIDRNSKEYVQYSILVTCNGLKWVCKRRYQNFCDLHDKLLQKFGTAMPALPKKTFFRKLDKEFATKRAEDLNIYLREILSFSAIAESVDVLSFLDFIAMKEEEEREVHPMKEFRVRMSRSGRMSLREVPTFVKTKVPLKLQVDRLDEFVDTGDIVLFHSQNFAAGLVQRLTASKWDHVGMVLKKFNRTWLLESTGAGGVQVYRLASRLRGYHEELGSTIALRKFESPDHELLGKRIFEFVSRVKGRDYNSNLGDFATAWLKQTDIFKGMFSQDKRESNHQRLFCSQLIAATLKQIEVLPDTKPSSEYLPKDFGMDEKLGLVGCELGDEVVVEFELANEGLLGARRMTGWTPPRKGTSVVNPNDRSKDYTTVKGDEAAEEFMNETMSDVQELISMNMTSVSGVSSNMSRSLVGTPIKEEAASEVENDSGSGTKEKAKAGKVKSPSKRRQADDQQKKKKGLLGFSLGC